MGHDHADLLSNHRHKLRDRAYRFYTLRQKSGYPTDQEQCALVHRYFDDPIAEAGPAVRGLQVNPLRRWQPALAALCCLGSKRPDPRRPRGRTLWFHARRRLWPLCDRTAQTQHDRPAAPIAASGIDQRHARGKRACLRVMSDVEHESTRGSAARDEKRCPCTKRKKNRFIVPPAPRGREGSGHPYRDRLGASGASPSRHVGGTSRKTRCRAARRGSGVSGGPFLAFRHRAGGGLRAARRRRGGAAGLRDGKGSLDGDAQPVPCRPARPPPASG